MTPDQVLQLVIANLNALGIAYMVGGSFASSAHGVPRSTLDADLVVDLKLHQVPDLVKLFARDFYVDEGQAKSALLAGRSFNLIHLESSFKIDLFPLRRTDFSQEQFSRRALERLPGESATQAYVASAEDTILSKLDWYRQGGGTSEQQWRDVIGVLKVQTAQLDLGYLAKWAVEIGVFDLLERALAEAGLSGQSA